MSNLVDIEKLVISVYFNPHCDLDLENSKPIFSYDTLAHDAASPYQVWLQSVQQLRRYQPSEYSSCSLGSSSLCRLIISGFGENTYIYKMFWSKVILQCCTHRLKQAAKQPSPSKRHCFFSLKQAAKQPSPSKRHCFFLAAGVNSSSPSPISLPHVFNLSSSPPPPTHTHHTQVFHLLRQVQWACGFLQRVRLCSTGGHWHWHSHWNLDTLLWSWPWTQQNNSIFSKDSLCHQTSFGCKTISSSEEIVESHNLTIWSLHCDHDLKDSKPVFSLPLMIMHHNAKFGDKGFSSSEDTGWINVHQHFAVSSWPCLWTQ